MTVIRSNKTDRNHAMRLTVQEAKSSSSRFKYILMNHDNKVVSGRGETPVDALNDLHERVIRKSNDTDLIEEALSLIDGIKKQVAQE